MTPAELREIGERLYGPKWQAKMARTLPVTPRTVRYWLSGERAIRPVIAERIKSLSIEDRQGTPPKNVMSVPLEHPIEAVASSAIDPPG